MSSFRVPRKYQQKVLLVGIIIALALRTVFILVGASVVNHFSFVFYIFGAFLIYTAITKLKSNDDDEESGDNLVVRLTRKVFPTTEGYVEDRLTTHVDGKRHITPMLIVMIAIGSADLLFAVDSIPAIFGLTQEVFLIFAANAFSLMGLRQLFFVIDGLLDKLVYLNYGLAAILAFIGGKLVLHALHENELGFINSGEPWEVIPEPTTVVSLVVIVAILFLTTLISLTFGRRRSAEGAPAAEEPGRGQWARGARTSRAAPTSVTCSMRAPSTCTARLLARGGEYPASVDVVTTACLGAGSAPAARFPGGGDLRCHLFSPEVC